MSDSTLQRCEDCGSELPRGVPPGLCPTCIWLEAQRATPEAADPASIEPAAPSLPRPFGDYELLEEIARGGMGVVYKAWQKRMERFVAIKMLLFGSHADADMILRFRGEAVMGGGLHHSNIVPIHEIGIRDGQHFIAMDYIEGMNLSVFLRTQPIPLREAVICLIKIARAVHYAHERNVLHRDLKPSNILLDSEGNPHVTDFGLARRIDGESTITISGQVLGSPNYMPPEQAAPRSGKVSRRSDVYGLGAILYHCLSGRPPFQADTLEATLSQVLQAEPVSPRLLNPSVPLDLETICLKCLEKEPSRRYETAQALADELERFLENRPIRARPISRTEKLARWCRRNPQLAMALAAAVLFLTGGFVVSVFLGKRAEREANSARLHLYVADMNVAQQALQRNNYGYAREKLLAHLPKKGWPDLRGWEWRLLWTQCGTDFLSSFDAGEAAPALALSSDAMLAAVVRRDGQVRVLDFRQQEFTTKLLARPAGASQRGIAFSPDGTWLAIANGKKVKLARPGLWNTREITNSGTVHSISFAGQGNRLLTTGSAGLKAWDIASGNEVEPPVTFRNDCRLVEMSADGEWLALSTDSTLMAWHVPSGKRLFSRTLGSAQVPALTLSSHGLLAACDREGFARVWDLPALARTGGTNPIVEWDTHAEGPNYTAAFSPDGTLLALGGSDQSIHVYSTTNWQRRIALKGHQSEVWALAFTDDSARLISAGKDGFVNVWDPRKRPVDNALRGSDFPLGFTPDGKFAVTLNNRRERIVQFWNVTTRVLDHVLQVPTDIVPQFQEIMPDGKFIVVRGADNVMHLLDLNTGASRGTLRFDTNALEHATLSQVSPDSKFIAVVTKRRRNGKLVPASELFRLDTRELIAVREDFRAMVFSQDGRMVGGKDPARKPAVWDLRRRRVKVFDGLRGELSCVAFSHDNRLFAGADADGLIVLWDLANGRRQILKGHRNGVGEIQFSHDDRTLFSTSTDRSLRLWNVATGQEMLSLTAGEETWELALSPDDTTLAVGSTDKKPIPARLWHAPPLQEIDAALHLSGR